MKVYLLRLLTSLTERALGRYAGLKAYQFLFEKLHALTLRGMNVGGGTNTDDSGEINALLYIKKQITNQNNPVIFDVGANIGSYTLVVKNLFPKASVYSFEPSLATFDQLKKNTVNLDNVRLFNIGFGEKDSISKLYYEQPGSGLSSIYKRNLDHLHIRMNMEEDIVIKTIDSFCYENKINSIDLLKLDVEGNELNILKGASGMLEEKKIKYIQFEFGGCNIDSGTYFKDFYYLLSNYNIHRILKDGLYKIDHYKETYEIFTTTNFLARLKNS